MRDSASEYKLSCKNGHIEKHFLWLSDLANNNIDIKCTTCNLKLKIVFEHEPTNTFNIIGKHKNGRSTKEKEARRIADYKKNLRGTLNKGDRAHLDKKFKIR